MTVHVGVSGDNKIVPAIWSGASGEWKRVVLGYVGVSGAWKLFYSSEITVSADNVNGYANGPATSGYVTGTGANVSVTNGSGVYTYLWTLKSGSGVSISSTTVASPEWAATVEEAPQGPNVSEWTVAVTDTVSNLSASYDITVTLTWENLV